MIKVGIVILNYNCSEFLHVTLNSLSRAKSDIKFSVGIVDNGSNPLDMRKAREYTDIFLQKSFDGFFIASEKNLGFSGGNNVAIKRFLDDKEITHICLLNADVIVTDGWLEQLLSCRVDAAGPVTNATGNEQTVTADYKVSPDLNAFDTVNAFAAKRYESFGGYSVQSDTLYYFNVLFHRRVFDTIGFLDERFYPGSFEDNDFCLRMKKAGMTQRIVRGCYVHHFGSGSFAKLDMPKRLEISNINRQRFEEKWGVKWEDDTWKKLESCRQDMACFAGRPMSDWAAKQISDAALSMESLIKNWAAAISWFQSDQYIVTAAAERGLLSSATQTVKTIPEVGAAIESIPAENPVSPVTSTLFATLLLMDSFAIPYMELSGKQLLKLAWIKMCLRLSRLLGSEKSVSEMAPKYRSVWTISGRQVPLHNDALNAISGKMMFRLAMKRAVIKLKRKFIWIAKPSAAASRTPIRDNIASANADTDVPEFDPAQAKIPSHPDQKLHDRLEKARIAGKGRIAVFAPMFSEENECDGYIQRIRAIDESALTGFLRIYLYESATAIEDWIVREIDADHIYILFSSHDPVQREKVFALVRECGLMYVHSINRFMTDSVAVEMLNLFDEKNVTSLWDVHGAVPEEYLMNCSEMGFRVANIVEKYMYERADVIISVNCAMREWLEKKYGPCKGDSIVLPIFNDDIVNGVDHIKDKELPDGAPQVVVYAGGLQVWQNVGLMKELVTKAAGKLEFRIFVPNPKDFWPEDMPQQVKGHMLVSTRKPEEIVQEYCSCHYGLVLRDDDTVNNVACPTKIIEYIQNGIVPVFKSAKIGDFVKLGLRYVHYERMAEGDIPTEIERRAMAEHNYGVLELLLESYQSGLSDLTAHLSEELNKAKKRLNILVVSEAFSGGGLETHIYSYYAEMRSRHNFYFAFGSFKNRLDIDTSIVYPNFHFLWESTVGQFVEDVKELVKLIEEKHIDVIHVHPFFSLFPALVAGQLTHIPVVFTYHGIASFSFPSRLNDTILYDYGMTELISKVFTVSNTCKRSLENNMRIKNAVFLPNSVNMKTYRKHTVISNKCWAVISRLDADNGKEECLRKLFRMLPFLDIQGVDIYGDGTRRSALEEYAGSQGLKGKVRWMGFQPDLYERLDGKYNGIIGTDRVTVEALAMGYPVLQMGYGRINGIMDAELLELAKDTNFDGNILPEIRNADELNSMLDKVYAAPEDFCFRSIMEKEFDIAKIAVQYEEELRGLKCREHANICEFYRALMVYENQNENFYRSQGIFYLLKKCIEYYAVNPLIKNLFLIGNYNYDLINAMNNHINGLN